MAGNKSRANGLISIMFPYRVVGNRVKLVKNMMLMYDISNNKSGVISVINVNVVLPFLNDSKIVIFDLMFKNICRFHSFNVR